MLTFDQLREGEIYNIHSKQFNVTNKARLISFDTTSLNRNIAYFQFSDRGYKPVSKERLIQAFAKDEDPGEIFSMWDFEVSNGYAVVSLPITTSECKK